MAGGVAADDIVTGGIFVHEGREGGLDARTFLIDGVVERVGKAVNGFLHSLHLHIGGKTTVKREQFATIGSEVLEFDAFRMVKKQKIHSLVDR